MSERKTLSRSEEVRERRTREHTKRQKQISERAYRPLPPVTSRGWPAYATPKQSRKANNRRYNIALGMLPESEMHVPGLSGLHSGPRMVSLLLILLLGAVLYFLWTSPYFRVSEAQITGLSRLNAAEINAALGINGQVVFLLEPEELATRLRVNDPDVLEARVAISLPNTVQVQVTERQPVLLWQQGDGYTWIDASGVAFRPHGDAPGLVPVVSLGTPPSGQPSTADPTSPLPYVSPELVKAALALAPIVPGGSTLTYDPANGFGWTDSRGWQVFFGNNPKDMPLKMRIYQSLVDSLAAQGTQPVFISLVQTDAPYYRMEK